MVWMAAGVGHRDHAAERFAEHDRVGARRIFASQVLALEMAAEVERHDGDALADPLRRHRHDLGLALLGSFDPDLLTVLDAEVVGVSRVHLDEHVLLQLGEPRIGPLLLAATLVLHKTA